MDRGQRRRDNQPKRPCPAPTPGGDHQPTSLYRLPDEQEIYVYKDRDDVPISSFREFISKLQERPVDPPPLVFDDYCAAEEAQVAPPQTATDMGGSTQPFAQFFKDRLNKASVDHKLQQAQRHADTEPKVLASKELLDTTTLKELSITNASSLSQPTSRADTEPDVLASKELLDTATLEGLSITSASSLPQTTSPLKELIPTPQLLQALDKARASANLFLTKPTDHAYHYWALEEPDMFSSNELFIVMATLGKSSITDASSTRAEAAHSPTPPISARKPAGWNHQFFIRVDLGGVFHTYPELDGPFDSLEEAEEAIFLCLDELEDPTMCTNDGLSRSEIAIRDALFWPDGTRKYSSESNPDEDHMGLLVQALLDKYNEENKLLGELAYQVENVVSFQEIYEGDDGWYYHLNCTRKTKGGVDNLFFAEVSKTINGELDEFELTCLHMLEPVDNGTCYGCTNDYIGMMKHPIDADKYKGGHDPSWPRDCGCGPMLDIPDMDMDDPLIFPKDMDARMKAEEERIRYLFQDHDEDVAKSDAGGTPADKSQVRRVKYVVPARRQLV